MDRIKQHAFYDETIWSRGLSEIETDYVVHLQSTLTGLTDDSPDRLLQILNSTLSDEGVKGRLKFNYVIIELFLKATLPYWENQFLQANPVHVESLFTDFENFLQTIEHQIDDFREYNHAYQADKFIYELHLLANQGMIFFIKAYCKDAFELDCSLMRLHNYAASIETKHLAKLWIKLTGYVVEGDILKIEAIQYNPLLIDFMASLKKWIPNKKYKTKLEPNKKNKLIRATKKLFDTLTFQHNDIRQYDTDFFDKINTILKITHAFCNDKENAYYIDRVVSHFYTVIYGSLQHNHHVVNEPYSTILLRFKTLLSQYHIPLIEARDKATFIRKTWATAPLSQLQRFRSPGETGLSREDYILKLIEMRVFKKADVEVYCFISTDNFSENFFNRFEQWLLGILKSESTKFIMALLKQPFIQLFLQHDALKTKYTHLIEKLSLYSKAVAHHTLSLLVTVITQGNLDKALDLKTQFQESKTQFFVLEKQERDALKQALSDTYESTASPEQKELCRLLLTVLASVYKPDQFFQTSLENIHESIHMQKAGMDPLFSTLDQCQNRLADINEKVKKLFVCLAGYAPFKQVINKEGILLFGQSHLVTGAEVNKTKYLQMYKIQKEILDMIETSHTTLLSKGVCEYKKWIVNTLLARLDTLKELLIVKNEINKFYSQFLMPLIESCHRLLSQSEWVNSSPAFFTVVSQPVVESARYWLQRVPTGF